MILTARRMFALSAIALASLSLSGCFSEEVDVRQTHEIQGLVYKIHDRDPFTGRVLNYPMSVLGLFSVGSCDIDIKKGLPDGSTRCVDNASKLLATGEFKGGKRDGLEERFDPATGKKTYSAYWKDGRQDGVQESYNAQSGDVIAQVHYTAGQKEGTEKLWDGTGKTVITQLEWDQGRQTGFDNRGETHKNFVDGKQDGLQQTYSINPQQRWYVAYEEHFSAGLREGEQKRIDARGNVTSLEMYSQDLIQSRTTDSYNAQSHHLHHVSMIATSTDKWEAEDSLVNDGSEQYWDDEGRLLREVQWRRGKVLSAVATNWRGDKQDSQYLGVGKDNYSKNQLVLKDGAERLFGDDGTLQAEIDWSAGSVVRMVVALAKEQSVENPGKMGILTESDMMWGRPVTLENAFGASSRFDGTTQRLDKLVDIPVPGQPVQVAAKASKSTADVDACVQKRVDAIHDKDPDALIRSDILEEFEQDCL